MYYGLPTYTIDGRTYAVAADEEEARRAATECILNSVWAFRPEFLASYMPEGIDVDTVVALQRRHEDANTPLVALLKAVGASNLENFIGAAIDADGLGHFLAYDGEERHNGQGHLIYRID